ncbi:alpha-tectorin-like [Strongylocentrotus purpuratus]|uniref:Uncharacterized protein n=1 Tax=Strongylocentrotus purpuratus TaxID=7668 RepID=A0A7M7HKF7_STRPU|nr:alpha-tectorin-like [Strongylocentrotus purpuratus]|eukprot:XP_011672676.1 PREDICTED: alpha-tectorin-like [Strongylocentrotus purpuratus]
MSWNHHISLVAKKANSTRAFLQRNVSSCPRNIKVLCYIGYYEKPGKTVFIIVTIIITIIIGIITFIINTSMVIINTCITTIAGIYYRSASNPNLVLTLADLVTGSNYGVQGSWLFEVSETIREIGKVLCEPTNPCLNEGTCENDTCVCAEGFSGNFCHLDGCDNRCLNGESCEQGNCTCPAGFGGDFCQDKLTFVECGSTSMTVNIDERLVPGEASAVHFKDRSCSGVKNDSTNEITLTTEYNQCGTIIEEDNTTITFVNVITYAKPGSDDDTVITREYHMQVKVACCLEKEEIISGSFRPQLGEVSFSDKGSGDFSLSLQRFLTNAFVELNSDATTVLQGDDLYFAVTLESVSGLIGMFIDRCWATTTQDMDSAGQHSLIAQGLVELFMSLVK